MSDPCHGEFNTHQLNVVTMNSCKSEFYAFIIGQQITLFTQFITFEIIIGEIIRFIQDVQFRIPISGQVIVFDQSTATAFDGQVVLINQYIIDPIPPSNQLSGYGGQRVYG